MDDVYYTIGESAQIELKVKGSRFIAETADVQSVEEANGILAAIRKREHAATHHCYAFRAGLFENAEFKYSDDGEPSGTAGRPIYDIVCGNKLDNILVVVTRYFGGTKLGTGGLVRAYSEAARQAVVKSGKKENFVTGIFDVGIDFAFYDPLLKLVNRLGAIQKNAEFSDRVSLQLEIRLSRIDELTGAIAELTNGKAKIERLR